MSPPRCIRLERTTTAGLLITLAGFEEASLTQDEVILPGKLSYTPRQIQRLRSIIRGERLPWGGVRALALSWGRSPASLATMISKIRRLGEPKYWSLVS